MSIYPFYISTEADGRKTPIAGGTKKKEGTMTTTVYQRDKGGITEPFKIRQYSTEVDGVLKLVTDVYYLGEVVKSHITDY